MSSISTQTVPPGGWKFKEETNGHDVWITSVTFALLIAAVSNHRTSNAKTIGNVTQDIMNQICSREPSTCQERPVNQQAHGFFDKARNLGLVLARHVKNGGKLHDQNRANINAQGCVNCHNNVPAAEAGCGSCQKAAVSGIKSQVIGDRTTAYDKQLGFCKLCGCDIGLMVWFPAETLGMNADNINAYPSFCFKKNLD